MRLVVMILLVTALPVAAVAAGRGADHLALRQARAQQAADHRVNAVLLQQAPATGTPDPYSKVQTAWVLAGLAASRRAGPVRPGPGPGGARTGSTVPTWVGGSGAVTDPTADPRHAGADVCIAVVLTCLASCLMLLGAEAGQAGA